MVLFFFKLSLFLPIAAAMGLVNWAVDPALVCARHRFEASRPDYQEEITRDLLAGREHHARRPYNEQRLDDRIFRNRRAIETLVLGSSVAKPIHQGLFPGEVFFNASVYGGRLEEMVAIYELARHCELPLRRLVLQIGAVLGNRPYPVSSDFADLVRQGRARLGVPDNEPNQGHFWTDLGNTLFPPEEPPDAPMTPGYLNPYDQMFSPRYLQLSLLFLSNSRLSAGTFQGELGPADRHLVHPDGSVQWAPKWRARSIAELHAAKPETLISMIEADALRPIARECRLFEALILDALHSETTVELVLLPNNPWLWNYARQEWERAGRSLPSADTEVFVRSVAARHGLGVRGSLDPERAGFKEQDFVDYIHLRREAIELLWNRPSRTDRNAVGNAQQMHAHNLGLPPTSE